MFQLTVNYPTVEALQNAVLLLSGEGSVAGADEQPAKPTKAAAKKAETAAATTAGLAAPGKPAAAGKGKAKAVSVEELKAHILTFVEPTDGEAIKAFVRTFGVVKISDLTEAQRKQAYDAAAEHFGAGEAGAGEDDPMN